MKNLLYLIAVVLIIGWLIGFFVYNAGSNIHILLVVAAILIIFRAIQNKRIA
jgi:hypothetical protein